MITLPRQFFLATAPLWFGLHALQAVPSVVATYSFTDPDPAQPSYVDPLWTAAPIDLLGQGTLATTGITGPYGPNLNDQIPFAAFSLTNNTGSTQILNTIEFYSFTTSLSNLLLYAESDLFDGQVFGLSPNPIGGGVTGGIFSIYFPPFFSVPVSNGATITFTFISSTGINAGNDTVLLDNKVEFTAIPEPAATVLLFALGTLGYLVSRRMRRTSPATGPALRN